MDEMQGLRGARAPSEGSSSITAPSIALPKGGGAIGSIGEKFSANPVTGTGSMTVPIATTPGRGNFGPQLALTYDSGGGNSIFGVGWALHLPTITRKTDKGLPRYDDAHESDVFVLSNAEDLVPRLVPPSWEREAPQRQSLEGVDYEVFAYCPRIEGVFARIERWASHGDTFWRSISRDNVTTWYGRTADARVVDPTRPDHVYSWLISESYDDKGNVIVYEYQREDRRNVDMTRASERNREPTGMLTSESGLSNTHIKRIKYGNTPSRLVQSDLSRLAWHMEVVFDYGEGHFIQADPDGEGREFVTSATPVPPADGAWPVRADPFSVYRAGFEVRTYRLCQRVLIFHRFDALGTAPALVRSTDFRYSSGASFTFLESITQSGYAPFSERLLKRSRPPLEFAYSPSPSQDTLADLPVQTVDADSLENLPVGLDAAQYQWVDLDGEGVAGVLLDHAGAWHYKRNLGGGRFGPADVVVSRPTLAARDTRRLMDLAADGHLDVVVADGAMAGFVERTPDDDWAPFSPFKSAPSVAWSDPDVRFFDLTGDGLADLVISEHEAFVWYRSLGEHGFAPAERVDKALDEEHGPRLVFSDGTGTILLADMSGDGLLDVVRIRNGEVSYWPNLGYGRFGGRVAMDSAPWFDVPDRFDPTRLRLADIDGSGVTDIVYLHPDAPVVYFNRSGNGWSAGHELPQVPRVDDTTDARVVDLLGTGTGCLVWSSPLPGAANAPLRYVDLMGSTKPHLLVSMKNNVGGITTLEYAASTRFYLADRAAWKPWVTRLPFPVHVVTRVSVRDEWRGTTFSSRYSYHHGYFDGHEREFRGFGRIDRVDVEDYGTFADGNARSPYITDDLRLFQPPVKTITWTHVGAALDRQQVLTQFESEYFPSVFPRQQGFVEKPLETPALPGDLDADEWREALRACKGRTLRVEVYELDVDDLAAGRERPVRLFTATQRNCRITRLQPRRNNRHAVFLAAEEEALDYHYELPLPSDSAAVSPDPRISHTLNLRQDEYGNVQQRITAVYGRVRTGQYPALPRADLIDAVQSETHVTYTENRYTVDCVTRVDANRIDSPIEHYRLRLGCETRTYELTGLAAPAARYFDIDDLRRHALCEDATYPAVVPSGAQVVAVAAVEYHETPQSTGPSRRIVERVRTLYFDDASATTAPTQPQPFGGLGPRGLRYEVYKLALTDDLLDVVFQQRDAAGQPVDALLDWIVDGSTTVPRSARAVLQTPSESGYFPGAQIDAALSGQYWTRSGIAGFSTDAAEHFFLPRQYTDAFGNVTTLTYDALDFLVASIVDSLGNTTLVDRFDYRVLAPAGMVDINGNHTEVRFDALGLVIAAATKGKRLTDAWQGDHLDDLTDALAEPPAAAVTAFCTAATLEGDQARQWLASASCRYLYHFGERRDGSGAVTAWAGAMAGACRIERGRHASQVALGAELDPIANPVHVTLECSDGGGHVLMTKIQAEADADLAPAERNPRWIVNGLVVVNNKGNPVKQYEPAFSARFGCEAPPAHGETAVTYYDAVGRPARTEFPDGTYSRVAFSPWHVETWDRNDTAIDSIWYEHRNQLDVTRPLPLDIAGRIAADPDQRAGWLVAQHAGTPAITIVDSLGRDVIAIARNRVEDTSGPLTFGGERWRDDDTLTFTKLDIEGQPLWVRDARGNLAVQSVVPAKPTSLPAAPDQWLIAEQVPAGSAPGHDIAGNLLYQHRMDAGDRWTLVDAAGKPLFAWDFNDRVDDTGAVIPESRLFHSLYDALHRPIALTLGIGGQGGALVEAFEYANTAGQSPAALADLQDRNLIGQAVRHWDPSGLVTNERLDFKDLVEETTRTLVADPTAPVVNWNVTDRARLLDSETFLRIAEHDALCRVTRLCNWHRDDVAPGASSRVAIYLPSYNARGLLESESLHVQATKSVDAAGRTTFAVNPDPARNSEAIAAVTYNAKGQKLSLRLGNGTTTRYTYDPQTFRPTRLFTRRDAGFTNDCAGDPDAPAPQRSCGVQNLQYTYDPVGNITHVQDDAQDTIWFSNRQTEPSSDYTYDSLYRLTEATGRENAAAVAPPPHPGGPWPQATMPSADVTRGYTQRYTYDAVGNFVTMQHLADALPGQASGDWTRHYTVRPDSNRLDQTWYGTEAAHGVTYRHDPHGNMLNLDRTAPGLDVRWDWRDTIRALDLQGGGRAYYSYDIDKQRTRKRLVRDGGVVEDRIYLGGYELYRRYAGGSAQPVEEIESSHLVYDEQRVLLVDDVITSGGTTNPRPDGLRVKPQTLWRYQYGDHLGSVTAELNELAQVISYEEFHPYGTSAYRLMNSAVEVPPRRYRYAGMERDEESDLAYHVARHYAPALGRWISPDSVVKRRPESAYSYSAANPIVNRDVDGLQEKRTTGDQPNLPDKWTLEYYTDFFSSQALEEYAAGYNEYANKILPQQQAAWDQKAALLGDVWETLQRQGKLPEPGEGAPRDAYRDSYISGRIGSRPTNVWWSLFEQYVPSLLGTLGGSPTAVGSTPESLAAARLTARLEAGEIPLLAETPVGLGEFPELRISAAEGFDIAREIYEGSPVLQELRATIAAGGATENYHEVYTTLQRFLDEEGLTLEFVEQGSLGERNFASVTLRPGYFQIDIAVLDDPLQFAREVVHEVGAIQTAHYFRNTLGLGRSSILPSVRVDNTGGFWLNHVVDEIVMPGGQPAKGPP